MENKKSGLSKLLIVLCFLFLFFSIHPVSAAVVSTPSIWVPSYNDHTVTKLNSSGATVGAYSVGSYPYGAAVDVSGNAWVVNSVSANVTKLSSSGTTLGTYSVGNNSRGIAIDASGNVWVANKSSNTVTKLNSSGTTLGTYSVTNSPRGIAVDASGNVWVSNYDGDTVTKLNSSGTIVGTYSVGDGPYGVAVDASGNIWVANNNGGNTVTKLNSSGTTLGTYSVGSFPYGVAVDVSGNVWVANYNDDTITKLNSSGTTLGTYSVGDMPNALGDFTGFALQYFVLGYSLPTPTSQSPVGIWHMDNNWADSSGNGNNGTASGNAVFTSSSRLGSHAGSFDGSNGYVDVPNSDSLSPTDELTISTWVKLNTLDASAGTRQRQPIVDKYGGSGEGRAYELIFDDTQANWCPNKFAFTVSPTANTFTGGIICSDITPEINIWYHVVARFKGGQYQQIWINGANHTEDHFTYGLQPSGIAASPVDLWIGHDRASSYFNGSIDEVKIWNRALSPDEIASLYGYGTSATYALTLTPSNGASLGNSFSSVYDDGSVITFTAVPTTGYVFDHWSGDATGSTNPLTITMDGNKAVIANFAPAPSAFMINLGNATASLISGVSNFLKNLFGK